MMKHTDEHEDEDMLPLLSYNTGGGEANSAQQRKDSANLEVGREDADDDDHHLQLPQSMNRTSATTRRSSIAKTYSGSLPQRLVSFSAYTARQAGAALLFKNSRRSRFVRLLPLLALATLCALQVLFWIIFMPPPSIRLPPPFYFDALQRFTDTELRPSPSSFASSADGGEGGQAAGWETRALNLLEQSRARRALLAPQYPKWKAALKAGTLEDTTPSSSGSSYSNVSSTNSGTHSVIPSTLFSSDRTPLPPAGWSEQWTKMGFEPVRFLNDEQADEWIAKNFPTSGKNGGQQNHNVVRAWKALPRGVMRADVLRYLLLLVEGGTWADMDVEPLGHLKGWTRGVKQLGRNSGSSESEEGLQQPIRMVVGIECDPVSYKSVSIRAWLEIMRLLPVSISLQALKGLEH